MYLYGVPAGRCMYCSCVLNLLAGVLQLRAVPEPVLFRGEPVDEVSLVGHHQYWYTGRITRVQYLFPATNGTI
jgi:hypothetical protein